MFDDGGDRFRTLKAHSFANVLNRGDLYEVEEINVTSAVKIRGAAECEEEWGPDVFRKVVDALYEYEAELQREMSWLSHCIRTAADTRARELVSTK